jgi:vacuolar protein sorting-associated protein VTA1
MALPADPHVKALQPFLQRAEELKGADPKVAYYCRVFAMEEGLKVSGKSNELVSVLGSLMETLERTKPDAGLVSPEEDSAYCENFALRIFAKADALDRRDGSERTAAKTAKMLYVASVFFEILHQFPGAVDEDTLAKQRYAAWRAGELSACAREGKTPPPPPSAEKPSDAGHLSDEMPESSADGNAAGSNVNEPLPASTFVGGAPPGVGFINPSPGLEPAPPPPAAYTPPSAPPAMPNHLLSGSDAPGAGSKPRATPSPPAALPPVNYAEGIGVASVAEAQKHAKFAVSALGFEDVPTAIENLQKALALLTGRLAVDGRD